MLPFHSKRPARGGRAQNESDRKWFTTAFDYVNYLPEQDDKLDEALWFGIGRTRSFRSNVHNLGVCVIEYHSDETYRIKKFEASAVSHLGEYLSQSSNDSSGSLKARLLLFDRHDLYPISRLIKGPSIASFLVAILRGDLSTAANVVGSTWTRNVRLFQRIRANLAGTEHLLPEYRADIVSTVISLVGHFWRLDVTTLRSILGCTSEEDRNHCHFSLESFVPGHITITPSKFQFVETTALPVSFESDIATYMSRLHTMPPPKEAVTIFYDKLTTSAPCQWRAILACSSEMVLAELVALFEKHAAAAYDPRFLLRYTKASQGARTANNLRALVSHLEDVRRAGLTEPSIQKLNYIQHLQDHLRLIIRFTKQFSAKSQKEWPPLDAVPTPSQAKISSDWSNLQQRQFYALRLRAEELLKLSTIYYAQIQDEIAARDSSRNKLIAVVAAIYLPFTLASGILGMNIREFSTYSSTVSNDPKAPSWRVLIAIALPLAAVTVALALTFDVLRRLAQRVVTLFPASLVKSFTFYLVFSAVTLACVFPIFYGACHDCW